MLEGRKDRDLDIFLLHTDDAWDRDSSIMAMIHCLMATVAGLVGGKMDSKKPDDFNATLKTGDSASTPDIGTVQAFEYAGRREAAKLERQHLNGESGRN